MPKKSATESQSQARVKAPASRKKASASGNAKSSSQRSSAEKAKKKTAAGSTKQTAAESQSQARVKAPASRKKASASGKAKSSAPQASSKRKSSGQRKEKKTQGRSQKVRAVRPKYETTESDVDILEHEQEQQIDFVDDIALAEDQVGTELSEQVEESAQDELAEEIALELPKELEPKNEKHSSREEDYALIDVIREGDRYEQEKAFKKLLSKYRGQIYNLILKIVHNPNEVEDLVQESFSKAFNSITNFNKEYAFSTWLYRIATNSSIDFLRKRRLKTFSIDNPIKTKDDEYTVEIPDSSEEPEKNVIQSQRDALVRDAIRQLAPKYRTVIEMRHLQELSYEEIAKKLKMPLGTVKAHIFRAREMLYKMLRDKLRSY
ncbi:MAG: sigma-70 family RNA polymerase sigma factor [Candidatus Thermochlorobacter sp.]